VYETTLAHTGFGDLLHVLVVPKSLTPDPQRLAHEVVENLGLPGAVFREPHGIVFVDSPHTVATLPEALTVLVQSLLREVDEGVRAVLAMDLLRQQVIPVELSPLTGQSLLARVSRFSKCSGKHANGAPSALAHEWADIIALPAC
jgi:hypothetical protein